MEVTVVRRLVDEILHEIVNNFQDTSDHVYVPSEHQYTLQNREKHELPDTFQHDIFDNNEQSYNVVRSILLEMLFCLDSNEKIIDTVGDMTLYAGENVIAETKSATILVENGECNKYRNTEKVSCNDHNCDYSELTSSVKTLVDEMLHTLATCGNDDYTTEDDSTSGDVDLLHSQISVLSIDEQPLKPDENDDKYNMKPITDTVHLKENNSVSDNKTASDDKVNENPPDEKCEQYDKFQNFQTQKCTDDYEASIDLTVIQISQELKNTHIAKDLKESNTQMSTSDNIHESGSNLVDVSLTKLCSSIDEPLPKTCVSPIEPIFITDGLFVSQQPLVKSSIEPITEAITDNIPVEFQQPTETESFARVEILLESHKRTKLFSTESLTIAKETSYKSPQTKENLTEPLTTEEVAIESLLLTEESSTKPSTITKDAPRESPQLTNEAPTELLKHEEILIKSPNPAKCSSAKPLTSVEIPHEPPEGPSTKPLTISEEGPTETPESKVEPSTGSQAMLKQVSVESPQQQKEPSNGQSSTSDEVIYESSQPTTESSPEQHTIAEEVPVKSHMLSTEPFTIAEENLIKIANTTEKPSTKPRFTSEEIQVKYHKAIHPSTQPLSISTEDLLEPVYSTEKPSTKPLSIIKEVPVKSSQTTIESSTVLLTEKKDIQFESHQTTVESSTKLLAIPKAVLNETVQSTEKPSTESVSITKVVPVKSIGPELGLSTEPLTTSEEVLVKQHQITEKLANKPRTITIESLHQLVETSREPLAVAERASAESSKQMEEPLAELFIKVEETPNDSAQPKEKSSTEPLSLSKEIQVKCQTTVDLSTEPVTMSKNDLVESAKLPDGSSAESLSIAQGVLVKSSRPIMGPSILTETHATPEKVLVQSHLTTEKYSTTPLTVVEATIESTHQPEQHSREPLFTLETRIGPFPQIVEPSVEPLTIPVAGKFPQQTIQFSTEPLTSTEDPIESRLYTEGPSTKQFTIVNEFPDESNQQRSTEPLHKSEIPVETHQHSVDHSIKPLTMGEDVLVGFYQPTEETSSELLTILGIPVEPHQSTVEAHNSLVEPSTNLIATREKVPIVSHQPIKDHSTMLLIKAESVPTVSPKPTVEPVTEPRAVVEAQIESNQQMVDPSAESFTIANEVPVDYPSPTVKLSTEQLLRADFQVESSRSTGEPSMIPKFPITNLNSSSSSEGQHINEVSQADTLKGCLAASPKLFSDKSVRFESPLEYSYAYEQYSEKQNPSYSLNKNSSFDYDMFPGQEESLYNNPSQECESPDIIKGTPQNEYDVSESSNVPEPSASGNNKTVPQCTVNTIWPPNTQLPETNSDLILDTNSLLPLELHDSQNILHPKLMADSSDLILAEKQFQDIRQEEVFVLDFKETYKKLDINDSNSNQDIPISMSKTTIARKCHSMYSEDHAAANIAQSHPQTKKARVTFEDSGSPNLFSSQTNSSSSSVENETKLPTRANSSNMFSCNIQRVSFSLASELPEKSTHVSPTPCLRKGLSSLKPDANLDIVKSSESHTEPSKTKHVSFTLTEDTPKVSINMSIRKRSNCDAVDEASECSLNYLSQGFICEESMYNEDEFITQCSPVKKSRYATETIDVDKPLREDDREPVQSTQGFEVTEHHPIRDGTCNRLNKTVDFDAHDQTVPSTTPKKSDNELCSNRNGTPLMGHYAYMSLFKHTSESTVDADSPIIDDITPAVTPLQTRSGPPRVGLSRRARLRSLHPAFKRRIDFNNSY